jgi:hypothetical protein
MIDEQEFEHPAAAFDTLGELVHTTMLSATGVLQAISSGRPSNSTRHMRQLPMLSLGC